MYKLKPRRSSSPVAVNLLTKTEAFDNVAWTKERSQVTANAITGPDGKTTADRVFGSAAAEAFANVRQTVTVISGQPYTFSAFVKNWQSDEMLFLMSDGVTAWDRTVDLTTGALSAGSNTAPDASTIQSAGNDWYRVSITATVGSTSLTPTPYIIPDGGFWNTNSDADDGFYIVGAQLEIGGTPGPYTPVT